MGCEVASHLVVESSFWVLPQLLEVSHVHQMHRLLDLCDVLAIFLREFVNISRIRSHNSSLQKDIHVS